MPRLLNQVVITSMATLKAEVCSIFLIEHEDDKDVVIMRAGSGFAESVVNKAKYHLGEGLTGHVAQFLKEYVFGSRVELEALSEDGKPLWKGKYDQAQWQSGQSEFRNGIVLPLIIRKRCLGVIKVENKLPIGDRFSDHDKLYLKTIANVVALAIENAKSHKRTDDVLSSITGALEGQLEMQRVLDKVVLTSMETLRAEVCSIFLIEREDDKDIVIMRAGSGFAERVVNKAKYRLGEGLTGHVAQKLQGYMFGSRAELEELRENGKLIWEGKHDRALWQSGQSEFRNGIVLPLVIRDRCLGVIKVENKLPVDELFTEHDELFLRTIANVVALAIENARSHQRTDDVLSSIIGALEGQLDMQRVLDRVVSTSMATLRAEVCSIFLIEREGDKEVVIMRAGSGFAEPVVNKAKYSLGEGLTGHVAQKLKGYLIGSRGELKELKEGTKRIWQGKYDQAQWGSGQSEFRNGIVLPLIIRNRCLGVIKVENKVPFGERFSEHDQLYLKTIANVVALAIESARFHERSEKQLKVVAAKAAHRINNQAANYDGIELFLDKEIKEGRNRERLEGILDRLRSATLNLKRMTTQITHYSKPLVLDRKPTSVNTVIRNEVEFAMNNYPKITFETHLDLEIPVMVIDGPRFAEAIKELFRNSAKAISRGSDRGGRIRVMSYLSGPAPSPNVEVVHIVIKDNGPGFPSDFPFFEPFCSTDPDSTGLGLATVKELVEAHKGSILKEDVEEGACIHIEIPLA